jgi:hypothetical protein
MDHSKTPKTTTSNAYMITTINHSTTTMHRDQAITQKNYNKSMNKFSPTTTNHSKLHQQYQKFTPNLHQQQQYQQIHITTSIHSKIATNIKQIPTSQQAIAQKSQPTSTNTHHNMQSLKFTPTSKKTHTYTHTHTPQQAITQNYNNISRPTQLWIHNYKKQH